MTLQRQRLRKTGLGMPRMLDVISVGELRPLDLGGLLTRGVAAGLVAGLAFLLAHMWFAVTRGMSALSPLHIMATVFDASSAPVPTAAEAVLGLTMHITLSLGFGMGFALALVPWLRTVPALVGGALGYGLALWVFNLHVLGKTVFPAFDGSHVAFQIFGGLAHPLIFGSLMIPFFLTRPAPETPPEPERMPR
ncbi:hypothetical protein [Streptomyces halobius]|uniref:DUF1440 domain-containing protein n=1 Tax=Streptomyces halobius TaxID=2879846 RepID=A0ABY4M2K5_9ACTN|nr:hypothetical protein [Streptomyces halobius]UQA91950.1 hypothetical protein K9S39_08870 [Streptomyces halobius]